MMNEITMSRLSCILLSLFPALWGIFSLLNNTADFAGTAQHAVAPLLTMQDTYQVPGLMWRAVTAEWAGQLGLAIITTLESLAGIAATVGVVLMLKHLGHSYTAFAKGKAWAMLGALCAIAVWGLGFMVVAGDWFMAWQAKENPLAVQLGALLYMVPNALTLMFLMLQRDARETVICD
jgi:predicted small integral membrane protein